jgi:pimeloyl-ACP methyl ester carboxylesterase
MPKEPQLVVHRNLPANQSAVIFIHGFSGNPKKTWGKFPELLAGDPQLSGWDIYSLGYHTGLGLDITGLWRADPDLTALAGLLVTAALYDPLKRYTNLALVAHSMGGLIAQRALVDDNRLRERVGHVMFFGTPSAGLSKASWFKFWKPQLQDMADDGTFVKDLRAHWIQTVGNNPKFTFCTTAGDQDQFVPRQSSIDPFLYDYRRVVNGDHLSIVKPDSAGDKPVQIVAGNLTEKPGAPAAARMMLSADTELQGYREDIAALQPKLAQLDEPNLVKLALALDAVGRREDSIKALQSRQDLPKLTDAMGVLAGRLKRRWLVDGMAPDAASALQLYQRGLEISEQNGNHAQAFYHGINVAFLQLAYLPNQEAAAQQTARKVLEHCHAAPLDKWRLATEGEVNLILGNTDAAIGSYRAAAESKPAPSQRELDSMYQQAFRAASILGNEAAAERLEAIFRGDA